MASVHQPSETQHQLLSCKICHKDYKAGVVDHLTLWCGHTHCRECVSEHYRQKHRIGTCPKLDCTGRLSSDPEWHPVTDSLVPPLQERKLKCKNCDQRFTKVSVEPLTLDCGHSSCRTCVKANSKAGNAICPECKNLQFEFPDNINEDLLDLSEDISDGSLPPDVEIREKKKGIVQGLRRSLGAISLSSESKEKETRPKLNRSRSEAVKRRQSRGESTVPSLKVHTVPTSGSKESNEEKNVTPPTESTNTKIDNLKDYYICQERNGLEIRVLKMQEWSAVDSNIKQFQFGNSNNKLPIRKLIFVGETGSGKTTLVNTMVNNIFGVNFSDSFRYSVCDLDNKNRPESESQTDFVTEYTFNYIDGLKRECNFVFVDTPGLGDTRGLKIQEENIKQILNYITKQSSEIGLVIQSSATRLNAEQKSILLDMKTLIKTGKIKSLIIMSTFADSDSPSAKDVLDGFSIPYSNLYLFNNNALYNRTQGISDDDLIMFKMNWNASNKSVNEVLDSLGTDVEAEVLKCINANEISRVRSKKGSYNCNICGVCLDGGLALNNHLLSQ